MRKKLHLATFDEISCYDKIRIQFLKKVPLVILISPFIICFCSRYNQSIFRNSCNLYYKRKLIQDFFFPYSFSFINLQFASSEKMLLSFWKLSFCIVCISVFLSDCFCIWTPQLNIKQQIYSWCITGKTFFPIYTLSFPNNSRKWVKSEKKNYIYLLWKIYKI